VHFDAHVPQAPQLRHDVRRGGVAQQRSPHGGVAGVNGHIQRAQMLLVDALPIRFGEVRQGHIGGGQERVAIVIVAQVERAAQSARQLGHEAEGATVSAEAHPVEHGLREGEAQVFIIVPFDLETVAPSVPCNDQHQCLLGAVEGIVDDVAQGVPVDGEQRVPRLDPCLFPHGARGH